MSDAYTGVVDLGLERARRVPSRGPFPQLQIGSGVQANSTASALDDAVRPEQFAAALALIRALRSSTDIDPDGPLAFLRASLEDGQFSFDPVRLLQIYTNAKDSNPARAEALADLGQLQDVVPKEWLAEVAKYFSNDKSWAVVASALQVLAEVAPDEALSVFNARWADLPSYVQLVLDPVRHRVSGGGGEAKEA